MTEQDEQDLIFSVKNQVDFIAQSFVRNKRDIERVMDIVELVIPRIRVIAKIESFEGVENVEHANLLEELGCDTIQGFYLSEALPRAEISEVLRVGVPGITKQRTNADIEETKKKMAEKKNEKLALALDCSLFFSALILFIRP